MRRLAIYNSTIGERLTQAIEERAFENGTSVAKELEELEISRPLFYYWKNNVRSPSSFFLQQMALAGYDVIYILTGEKQYEREERP